MCVPVKTGKAQCEQMFSALPPKADFALRTQYVRFVPNSEVEASFNYLVGASEQGRWNVDAKRVCRLEVHHQLEPSWLFDRQVRRLHALENLVDEDGGPTIKISKIGPVGQKETRLR